MTCYYTAVIVLVFEEVFPIPIIPRFLTGQESSLWSPVLAAFHFRDPVFTCWGLVAVWVTECVSA